MSFVKTFNLKTRCFVVEGILPIFFQHGKKDVVRALLNEGADPGVLDSDQKTSIDVAHGKEMQQVFAGVLLQAIAVDK